MIPGKSPFQTDQFNGYFLPNPRTGKRQRVMELQSIEALIEVVTLNSEEQIE